MDEMPSQKQYKIPWVYVISVLGLFLGALLLFIVPAAVLFIRLVYYPETVTESLFLKVLFLEIFLGAVFFIKERFWIEAMFYPIKKWIHKNVTCTECGQPFTKCEYAMESPFAFVSFVCYCENCRKARLIETETFGGTLRFKPDRSIESLYEKKYRGKTYRVPAGIFWILYPLHIIIIGLTIVFILFGIPVLVPIILYVHYFGPSKEAAETFRTIGVILWLPLFILYYKLYDRFHDKLRFIRDFETYPMRKWILNNVRCPKCKDHLTKCDVKVRRYGSGFKIFDYMSFVIYCKHCKRQRTLKMSGFDLLLRFV